MNLYTITALDCFGLAHLTLILINTRRIPGYETPDRRLFRILCYVNMAGLILDMSAWLLEGRSFDGAYYLLKATNALYFATIPLMGFMWILYMDYKVYGDTERVAKCAKILAIPFILNAILSFSNFFADTYFAILPGNIYERGGLFWISTLLSMSYIFISPFYLLANRKRINRKTFLSLMFFVVPPAITSVTQLVFYGTSLVLVGTELTLMLIFITIQNDSMTTDSLTGLNNRRCLENFLQSELNAGPSPTGLTGLMIDIDDFKSINDTYGHMTGDRALEDTAFVLLSSVRRDDFAARYAGDEFVIIIRSPNEADGERIAARLHDNIAALNATGRNKYTLSLSIGVYSIAKDEKTKPELFLSGMDERMYTVKTAKKVGRAARKSDNIR